VRNSERNGVKTGRADRFSPGQTTIESFTRNASIVRTVVDAMRPLRSDAILLVVANPVDLLTSLARGLSRLPPAQVLGSGTFLDTLRMRGLLADRAGVGSRLCTLEKETDR